MRNAELNSLIFLSLRSRANGCGNPFFFKGNTDSFVLRTQNDKPLSYHEIPCGYVLICRPVIARGKAPWQSVPLKRKKT